MADTTNTTTTAEQTNSQAETQAQNTGENKTPSVEELMAQLAAERAASAKNKRALDTALKEKGELAKSLRARQTAEEQAAADKQAEDERRQQAYEQAVSELNQIKAEQAYTPVLTEARSIETIISAVSDGDHKAIAQIIDTEKKAAVKAARAEWNKSRPQVNVGSGRYAGLTVEQIMAIPDRSERRRAIAENQDLFK